MSREGQRSNYTQKKTNNAKNQPELPPLREREVDESSKAESERQGNRF